MNKTKNLYSVINNFLNYIPTFSEKSKGKYAQSATWFGHFWYSYGSLVAFVSGTTLHVNKHKNMSTTTKKQVNALIESGGMLCNSIQKTVEHSMTDSEFSSYLYNNFTVEHMDDDEDTVRMVSIKRKD